MDSVDLDVLKRSAAWLDEGRRVLLVTVVKTWGSSPRPEGAMRHEHQSGIAVRRHRVLVGAFLEQELEDFGAAFEGGVMQRRPAAVRYLRAFLDQDPGDRELSLEACIHERRVAERAAPRHAGLAVDQQRYQFLMAEPRRDHQDGIADRVGGVRIQPLAQERRDGLCVSVIDGLEELIQRLAPGNTGHRQHCCRR